MRLRDIKIFFLIILATLVIFYLIIAGTNLGMRLTLAGEPKCNPLFCQDIVNEASYCLLSTPGSESCLKVAGFFFVVSKGLAYSLLGLSFALSYLIYRRLYLERVLIALALTALLIFSIRVFLGASTFTVYGVIYEIEKLGLFP